MDRPEIAEIVKQGLKDYHSPDQIAGRMKLTVSDPRDRISATTIYRWIDAQSPGTWDRYLRRYGKRRRGRKPGGMPGATRISGRPEEAEQRSACGHWEGDTVWGSQRCGGLVTLVDRKSRLVLLIPTKDRTARRVRLKVQKLFESIPAEQRRSITFDNGKEFAEHKLLAARVEMPVFFADPYASWQRGTNENTNGLVRQFFPKGTSLQTISSRRAAHVARLLNHDREKPLVTSLPAKSSPPKKRLQLKLDSAFAWPTICTCTNVPNAPAIPARTRSFPTWSPPPNSRGCPSSRSPAL
jgi:IS30 family transposase